ncbi:MAG TPA: hypothetical protein VKP30_07155 [Polyangiaceae bacterium]|nr:hypothetical protein [Polyangiaceae bacterium]
MPIGVKTRPFRTQTTVQIGDEILDVLTMGFGSGALVDTHLRVEIKHQPEAR